MAQEEEEEDDDEGGDDNDDMKKAADEPKGGAPAVIPRGIAVRTVSCTKQVCRVRSRLRRFYYAQAADKAAASGGEVADYLPALELPFLSRVILIFQRIDGIDVLLFVLYIQEYGDDCPAPNRRKAYISYLDSVNYMRPRRFRTACYQEALLGYIQFAQERNLVDEVYIWACPPQRGDAYILHCHPKWQRTPSADRLRKWYQTINEIATEEGLVEKTVNLVDKCFSNVKPHVSTRSSARAEKKAAGRQVSPSPPPGNSAAGAAATISEDDAAAPPMESLPYFEGDYTVTEAENQLGLLEKFPHARGDHMAAGGGAGQGAPLSGSPPPPPHRGKPLPVSSTGNAAEGVGKPAAAGSTSAPADGAPHPRAPWVPTAGPSSGVSDRMKQWWASTAQHLPPDGPPSQAANARGDAGSSGGGGGGSSGPATALAAGASAASGQSGAVPVQMRTAWLVRRLAAKIIPLKDSFFVLHIRALPRRRYGGSSPRRDRHPPARIVSNVFDTRLQLLGVCQRAHLQFDELRRAKHSSVVLLNHIHTALREAGEGRGGEPQAKGACSPRHRYRTRSTSLSHDIFAGKGAGNKGKGGLSPA